jgi:hypothetical protein
VAERKITQHAIQRFIERIDRSATPARAWQRIAEMAAAGTVRPKPRWWTDCRSAPGTVFIYWADQPSACLVATHEAIVTVVSRDLCAVTRRGRDLSAGRRRGRRPRQLEASWRDSRQEAA